MKDIYLCKNALSCKVTIIKDRCCCECWCYNTCNEPKCSYQEIEDCYDRGKFVEYNKSTQN